MAEYIVPQQTALNPHYYLTIAPSNKLLGRGKMDARSCTVPVFQSTK
jgi:hypothetical protein